MKQIAVYCSSSNALDRRFYEVAEELGRLMARHRIALVFGGGNVGLMGYVARAVHEGGGQVIGVIPERLNKIDGRAYAKADELIVTESMSERKSIIWRRSDAFVVLSGGVGTLEEFMEVITLKKLGYHQKPVTLVNSFGIYNSLLEQFSELDREGFSAHPTDRLFDVVASPEQIPSLESFQPFF